MNSKVGMLLTSRNNYDFMERHWIPRAKVDPYLVLNIDEDSFDAEKAKGRALCSEHGIEYLDRDKRGLQFNVHQACRWFKDRGVKFVIWYQHDCWPIYPVKFYHQFEKLVDSGSLDQFGTVGFNTLTTDVINNYKINLAKIQQGKRPMGVVARCIVEPHVKYYTGTQGKGLSLQAMPRQKRFKEPFSVEVVCYFAIAVNVDLVLRVIKPTSDYHYFMAWDDLSFQFLNHNIHNVVLPSMYVAHRPDLKPEVGIPTRSTRSSSLHHDKIGREVGIWIRRWGWNRKKRETYRKVAKRYKGTLIDDFFNHNPLVKGPLKSFDLS